MNMLERVFDAYTCTREYSVGIGATNSESEKQLRKLLESDDCESSISQTVLDLMVGVALDYERQGFLNGFRLAIGILKDC